MLCLCLSQFVTPQPSTFFFLLFTLISYMDISFILFTALMNYKWTTIMTVQGDSVSFCLSFFITWSLFYHVITFFADLFLIFHRDFTNPNLPTEQKGRPSQVCCIWLFLFIYLWNLNYICEVHSNRHYFFLWIFCETAWIWWCRKHVWWCSGFWSQGRCST